MLVGHIHAPRQIKLIEASEPELDGDDQIIFQPELACLCGSDEPYFSKDYEEFQPKVGQSLHEMIGTVVATSGDRFQTGDRVLCVPDEHHGLQQRFCIRQQNAIPVDPRPTDAEAVLAQPLGTVLFAMRDLPNILDWNVVVVGQGPMGLLFTGVVRNLGAREIIALDIDPSRLEASRKMGASATINPHEQDPVAAVRELTAGGMADLVVEAVGRRDRQINLAAGLCRPHGDLLMFGVPTNVIDGIDFGSIFWNNITLHTSVGPDFIRDFPLAMRWIAEGRIDVTPLITHRFPLEKIQEAYETFVEHRDGAIKVFVEFP